jgi:hypothetical protein
MVRNLSIDSFRDFPNQPLRIRLLDVELAEQLAQLVNV